MLSGAAGIPVTTNPVKWRATSFTASACSLLVAHAALNDALHLQRVWHPEKRRRTQTKRSAFGVRHERDAVTCCISISQRRRHLGGNRFHRFRWSTRQVLRSTARQSGRNQTTDVVIEDRREVCVTIRRQACRELRRVQ